MNLAEDLELYHDPGDEYTDVTDIEDVSRVVRKIRAIRTEQEVVKRTYAAEIAHLQGIRDRRLKELEEREHNTLAFYQPLIEQVLPRYIPEGKKSVELPHGTLGWRQKPRSLKVTDDQALLRWAKDALPGAVEVVEKVNKVEVSKHYRECGEVPQGCEEVPERDEFFVRTDP